MNRFRRTIVIASLLLIAAVSLAVRESVDGHRRKMARDAVFSLGGKVGSLSSPIPFVGSELRYEFHGTNFSQGDLQRLTPLAELGCWELPLRCSYRTATRVKRPCNPRAASFDAAVVPSFLYPSVAMNSPSGECKTNIDERTVFIDSQPVGPFKIVLRAGRLRQERTHDLAVSIQLANDSFVCLQI